MVKLGIVQSTDRIRDREALKDLVRITNRDIDILSLTQHRGPFQDQIINFLTDKDAILFILLSENSALHFIAGAAVGLRKRIGFLCDASIYLPFSVREHPFSVIHRTDDLELAIASLMQKILGGGAQELISDLQRAGKQVIENRRAARTATDHVVVHARKLAGDSTKIPEPPEEERIETESYWTRQLAKKFGANKQISARVKLESGREGAFDIILWNSDHENLLSLFENPIAVEVKATRKLASKTVTQLLNNAQRQNIRSVIIATTARVPPSEKERYIKRAKSKGVTLGIIESIDSEAVDSETDLLVLLSTEGVGG
jgi:hypothetical protein